MDSSTEYHGEKAYEEASYDTNTITGIECKLKEYLGTFATKEKSDDIENLISNIETYLNKEKEEKDTTTGQGLIDKCESILEKVNNEEKEKEKNKEENNEEEVNNEEVNNEEEKDNKKKEKHNKKDNENNEINNEMEQYACLQSTKNTKQKANIETVQLKHDEQGKMTLCQLSTKIMEPENKKKNGETNTENEQDGQKDINNNNINSPLKSI